MEPIIKIEAEFGTISIYPPEKPPTADDKNRLYRVLLECLVEKGWENGDNSETSSS